MKRLAVMGLMMMLGTGCGAVGARTSVVAKTSEVPVSMSRGVRDANGNLVPAESKKVVSQLDESYTAWNLFYGLIKLTPETDISNDVNTAVHAAGGQAVTNLSVATKHCALNGLLFPFGLLPFWPSCASISVHGDVIKVADANVKRTP